MLDSVTTWLEDIAASPWFYLVIYVVAVFDSIIPIVPSETTVIIGGVSAGLDPPEKRLGLVILCAALGAFCGDNLAYLIGARAGPRIERRAGEKTQKRLLWAHHQLAKRGGMLLITARFVPGGRTAVTVTSGITRQPWRRFAFFIAIAAVIWASYAALLGYIGGKSFEDNHTLAFVFAFVVAVSISLLIELVRHLRERAKRRAGEAELHDDAPPPQIERQ
jgi:membrane protein DedA with SNARE-associated domain